LISGGCSRAFLYPSLTSTAIASTAPITVTGVLRHHIYCKGISRVSYMEGVDFLAALGVRREIFCVGGAFCDWILRSLWGREYAKGLFHRLFTPPLSLPIDGGKYAIAPSVLLHGMFMLSWLSIGGCLLCCSVLVVGWGL